MATRRNLRTVRTPEAPEVAGANLRAFQPPTQAAHTPDPVRPPMSLLVAFSDRPRPAAEAQPSLESVNQLETINPT